MCILARKFIAHTQQVDIEKVALLASCAIFFIISIIIIKLVLYQTRVVYSDMFTQANHPEVITHFY